ncbi:MAG: hypothetical protein L0206_25375, partial [Actinobacteria bacterium]|nr:hypothetical protein [Actinomycetota bacterium]
MPTGPKVGAKELTTGALPTTKLAALVPVPTGLVTLMGPVVAPLGTVAWISVSETTRGLTAKMPLNETAVASANPEPVITTA